MAAAKFPSLWYASQLFVSTTTFNFLTDTLADTFAFHKLLHYKMTLLNDETELLRSARQIVEHFVSKIAKIANVGFGITIDNDVKVSKKSLSNNILSSSIFAIAFEALFNLKSHNIT